MYIPKSYILASIMKTKIKYFRDGCVTDRELNVLTDAMQKRFIKLCHILKITKI